MKRSKVSPRISKYNDQKFAPPAINKNIFYGIAREKENKHNYDDIN